MESGIEHHPVGRQGAQDVREPEMEVELLLRRQGVGELVLVHVKHQGTTPPTLRQHPPQVGEVQIVGAQNQVVGAPWAAISSANQAAQPACATSKTAQAGSNG